MASKISIYGLSGSGKSCYIYAMTKALSKGVKFDNGKVMTMVNSDLKQVNLLNQRFKMMVDGVWPPGTSETSVFTYRNSIAFKLIANISIRDYRGGIFSSIEEDDMNEIEDLYKSFKDSGSLAFFIGVDKVMRAMKGDVDAFNDLGMMHNLYAKYLETYPNDTTPIIFVLTKADLASPEELEACKNFVRDNYAAFFGAGTGLTVGLTAVTLGRNLGCGADNELIGELRVGPSEGNIQIPILFTIFGIYSKRIAEELERNASLKVALEGHLDTFAKKEKQGFFSKLWYGGTSGVKKQIEACQDSISKSDGDLLLMADCIDLIKSKLRDGVEIYIDGELQNM